MADPVPSGQSVLSTPVAADASVAPSVEPASSSPDAATLSAAPSSTSNWFDELPDGLKTNPTLQNFKSKGIKDVVESFVNAEKLIGGSLRLPSDKDTPAERQAKLERVYTQLGRPEKSDGYVITPPADSTVPFDAARVDAFKQTAHKLGLTQAQAEGLVAFDTQRAMESQVDTTQAYNSCMETLQKDWGAGAKTMLGLSRRTAATYFDAETLAQLDAAGVSNNPKFVKALASMGKELMEEGLIVGAREGMDEDGGISAMQTEYNKVMQDSKHAYWDSSNPAHDSAVERMVRLQQALLELAPTAR